MPRLLPYIAPLALLAAFGGTCFMLPAPPPVPTDVKAEMAIAYMKLKQDERAGRLFAEVLAADPDNVRANHAIGIAATSAKRYDEALARLKSALAKDPGNVEIEFALGVAYQKAKRLNEAEAIYQKLRKAYPDDGRFLNNLAEIAIARGQYQEARSMLQEYLKMLPAKRRARRKHVEKRIKALTAEIGDAPSPAPSPKPTKK